MRLINRLVEIINVLSSVTAHIGIVLLFAMGLLIAMDVMLRYVFNQPTQFTTEMTGYLMAGVTFLGLPYTLMKGKHIRIEVATSRLSPTVRKRMEVGTSIVCLAFLAVCLKPAWMMVWESYIFKSEVMGSLNTPLYLPQLLVPVGISITLLQMMAITIDKIKDLKRPESPESEM
jgi:TRAP-type C4-dicarboxylate transport system permease small subunit